MGTLIIIRGPTETKRDEWSVERGVNVHSMSEVVVYPHHLQVQSPGCSENSLKKWWVPSSGFYLSQIIYNPISLIIPTTRLELETNCQNCRWQQLVWHNKTLLVTKRMEDISSVITEHAFKVHAMIVIVIVLENCSFLFLVDCFSDDSIPAWSKNQEKERASEKYRKR